MTRLKIAMTLWCLLGFGSLFADKVGLLVMATGKYIQFVEPLVKSAEKHFCTKHQVTYFIFTDGTLPPADNVVVLYQSRLGWPFDTMMRYHAYAAHADLLAKQDYLFACDADMLFVDTVGDEILGERVATQHPAYYFRRGTYETNPISTAYVRYDEGTQYYAGGFYGGSSKEFIKILHTNIGNIYQDLLNGYIAVWHDESHWNRYCIDHPPTIVLSPSYCSVEGYEMPFPQKLVALNKNHDALRTP